MSDDWSCDLVTRTGFAFYVRPATTSSSAIGLGTALLTTRDSLKIAGTGMRLTVIAADSK